jgi:hypothetical protein
VEQPDRAAAEMRRGFVLGRTGLALRCAAPAASPRKRSSGRPRDSGRRVLRPVREELSLDWDWANPQPRATPASPRPRKPGPWTEIAAAVRREATRSAQDRDRRKAETVPPAGGTHMAPLGAPLPSLFSKPNGAVHSIKTQAHRVAGRRAYACFKRDIPTMSRPDMIRAGMTAENLEERP